MSADFWAGYISGAVGIIIGNPLDMIKVRLQVTHSPTPLPETSRPVSSASSLAHLRPWITGTAAPVVGYGALNALLFVSYNRSESTLNRALHIDGGTGANLWTTWAAGAIGGLATWIVSTPTELVKCRAQLASPPTSSWAITKQVLQAEGFRGLYFGGVVTALRDSIGYGFYFWSYELGSRWMANLSTGKPGDSGESPGQQAAKVLLCGGMAGIVTWASIFPLDVIKTRVQTQVLSTQSRDLGQAIAPPEGAALLAEGQGTATRNKQMRLSAWDVAKEAYREEGIRPFFRGLTVCSIRAFVVNAIQWAVYEWIMAELGQGRVRKVNFEMVIPAN